MMVNTASQIATKRKKKFTGGNASKRHRDRVNIEFNNLAKLLPFPENVIAKLDKSSILRLAVSYIRAKSFFKDALPVNEDDETSEKSKLSNEEDLYKGILEETCLTEFFLQALDGFLIVITEDLKVLYVSESVREYLGYCQAGIIHESFLQFIHWGDEESIKNALRFDPNENGIKEQGIGTQKVTKLSNDEVKKGRREQNGKATESTFSSRIQSRRFVCRMKCAFSCSSRFYTAFQAFQFSGHVRRSTIQEGKEQRTLNTLIAFGCPLSNSKIDPHDLISESFDETRLSYEDGDQNGTNGKMIGLQIEPRLRPHIAPIPIAQNEPDGKSNPHSPHHYPLGRRFSIGAHPDSHFNGNYGYGGRMNSSYHRLATEYYRDTHRFSNGWNGRSSSLSNSPISDASSPRGMKRSASADGASEGSDLINGRKLSQFEGPAYSQTQNGFNGLPLDDIHSSAKILMQLKSTQRRLSDGSHLPNEVETDSNSSEDRSEIYRNCDTYEYMGKEPVFVDRQYPSVLAAKFHPVNGYAFDVSRHSDGGAYRANEASYARLAEDKHQQMFGQYGQNGKRCNEDFIRERIAKCKLSPNEFRDARIRSSRIRSSPERGSRSQIYLSRYSPINGIRTSPSRQSPPKKEVNRGFHISTILGLKDDAAEMEVAGQQKEQNTRNGDRDFRLAHGKEVGRDVETGRSEKEAYVKNRSVITTNGAAKGADSERLTEAREKIEKERDAINEDSLEGGSDEGETEADQLNEAVSNMDDIKTSFAHLLQGFTATITRSIDQSIDTIFKP